MNTPVATEAGRLLACPFCGSDQVSLSEGETGDGQPWPYVECEDCAATATPENWNHRAMGTRLVDAAKRAIPFLRDEAASYEDDGSNEPLETAREIGEDDELRLFERRNADFVDALPRKIEGSNLTQPAAHVSIDKAKLIELISASLDAAEIIQSDIRSEGARVTDARIDNAARKLHAKWNMHAADAYRMARDVLEADALKRAEKGEGNG